MSVFEDSFVILNDDASESVPVSGSFDATDNNSSFSAHDGSVQVDDSLDDVFAAPSPDYGAYSNGDGVFGSNGEHDGPILPPPSEMESDEGFALREWRRLDLLKSFDLCYFWFTSSLRKWIKWISFVYKSVNLFVSLRISFLIF